MQDGITYCSLCNGIKEMDDTVDLEKIMPIPCSCGPANITMDHAVQIVCAMHGGNHMRAQEVVDLAYNKILGEGK